METAKWVILYTSNLWMLTIESIEFGKNQWEYPKRNEESWSTLEEFIYTIYVQLLTTTTGCLDLMQI